MIILDLETSGLDYRKSSILSIGAVDFDNLEDTFYGECQVRDGADINPESLKVCGFTEAEIHDPKKPSSKELLRNFLNWLSDKNDQTIAGQNVHWDMEFLREECKRSGIDYRFGHRIVDLHSIAYGHLIRTKQPISLVRNRTSLDLDNILVMCGFEKRKGRHNALEDAVLEAKCFEVLLRN